MANDRKTDHRLDAQALSGGQVSATPPTSRVFYDRISGVYDLIADGGEHRARELGLELFSASPGEHILEIGFGTGHALVDLAEAVGVDGIVSGTDLSEGMRSVAGRRVTRKGLEDRVTLRCSEVPPLAYEDGQFDAVFLSFTLELFPLPRIPEVLHEIRRVLRPGGRVGIVSMATALPEESESPLEKGYKWMHRHFPHIVDCQPIEVERYVREAGFDLEESERIALFTLPVAVVVGRKTTE